MCVHSEYYSGSDKFVVEVVASRLHKYLSALFMSCFSAFQVPGCLGMQYFRKFSCKFTELLSENPVKIDEPIADYGNPLRESLKNFKGAQLSKDHIHKCAAGLATV